jgi:hypothetical protein
MKTVSENIWVEITKSEHRHGGKGWEFGTCLWSPSKNRAGIDRYAIMREPKPGEKVLHFYHDIWPDGKLDTRISGQSLVKDKFREIDVEPPNPGQWSSAGIYYRIDLQNYVPLDRPLPLKELLEKYGAEIRREIIENKPSFYPFNTHLNSIRTVQGIYLARCTENLYSLITSATKIEAIAGNNIIMINPHEEYSEAMRYSRERYFWVRNPKLARDSKEHFKYICQICSFNFEKKYGELGKGYIECHHLNPLSERAEEEWTENIKTNLNETTVLCANCHRVVHRKRPAYSIDTVKQSLI